MHYRHASVSEMMIAPCQNLSESLHHTRWYQRLQTTINSPLFAGDRNTITDISMNREARTRWYQWFQYDGYTLVRAIRSCIPPKVSPAQPTARSSTLSLAQYLLTPSLLRHCLCDGGGVACACCCWSLLCWWSWWSWLTVVVVVRVTMMLPGKRFAPGGVAARGWRAHGLQMRMMAAAMVVNIVRGCFGGGGWF
jgi:hypothetical protein